MSEVVSMLEGQTSIQEVTSDPSIMVMIYTPNVSKATISRSQTRV
jgi:hypothetical protein